jgi:hypothetical protein
VTAQVESAVAILIPFPTRLFTSEEDALAWLESVAS